MNDLLVGLLSALVATNPPAAVSNLVQQKTGIAVPLTTVDGPVEREFRRLMEADDDAQAEVDKWIVDRQRANVAESEVEKVLFRARIKRRFDPVIKGYEEFLQKHPQHAGARVAYGSFLNDIGQEDAAEKQWEKARELNPKDPAVWNNLANFYGHNGDVKKSFDYYAKAIELEPDEPVYYQNLATTVFLFRKDAMEFYKISEQQVFAKAMDLYRKGCALDPQNFSMAAELAQTYYGIKPDTSGDAEANRKAQLKLAEEALAAWQVAQRLSTNDLEREGINLHFARWQINSGRYGAARQSLELVTNQFWSTSRKNLTKKVDEHEARSLTNSLPAAPTLLPPKP